MTPGARLNERLSIIRANGYEHVNSKICIMWSISFCRRRT